MSTSVPSSQKKIVVLQSSDGEVFEVEEAAATKSVTIKNMIEDDCANTSIPLPNVTSKILSMVIEYCQHHTKNGDDSHQEFDADFVNVDQGTLFDLMLAANYLNIKSLLDLTCQTVANRIKDKAVEDVRTIFNIKNDYTPEEEAEVRKENAWAFE